MRLACDGQEGDHANRVLQTRRTAVASGGLGVVTALDVTSADACTPHFNTLHIMAFMRHGLDGACFAPALQQNEGTTAHTSAPGGRSGRAGKKLVPRGLTRCDLRELPKANP